jgi:hypothetical protein
MRESKTNRAAGDGTAMAGLAAIGSVLAASSCCLPIFPFVMAAGVAGSSAFLNAARPYLLAVSVLFIAFGFFQASRAKKCNRKPSAMGTALLWFSTLFAAVSIFFPQAMAGIAADLLAR